MENQKNSKGIIALLIVVIVILSVLCILFATNIISFNSNSVNIENKQANANNTNSEIGNDSNNENTNSIKYDTYNKGNEIELNDGSKWIVLSDSSSSQDYVTAIAVVNTQLTDNYSSKYGEEESKEFYNQYDSKVNYDDSYIKKALEEYYLPKISAKLKTVNGYKIRLITLEEILNLNNGWVYNADYDSYTYTGTEKISNSIIASITMTHTKCNRSTTDKCSAFYVITTGCESFDSCDNPKYYIEHWSSGLPNLVPVINVYKTEINK